MLILKKIYYSCNSIYYFLSMSLLPWNNKFNHNFKILSSIATAAKEGGADGVTAINTVSGNISASKQVFKESIYP